MAKVDATANNGLATRFGIRVRMEAGVFLPCLSFYLLIPFPQLHTHSRRPSPCSSFSTRAPSTTTAAPATPSTSWPLPG